MRGQDRGGKGGTGLRIQLSRFCVAQQRRGLQCRHLRSAPALALAVGLGLGLALGLAMGLGLALLAVALFVSVGAATPWVL